MKRLVFILTLCLSAVFANAQDQAAAELKNAGNEALRSKDYAKALEAYEKYMASGEEGVADDAKTIYAMATCARKLKNSEKSLKYLQACVDKGYKADLASYYIAGLAKSSGDMEKAKQLYADGLQKYGSTKTGSYFKKALVTILTKEAAALFNTANETAGKAAGNTDPSAYMAVMKKAVVQFNTAKDAFNKVLEIDANNTVAKGQINNINASIKAYEDYKASLKK
ncbi:tetratricopeptide repeat protein [Puteibacter caeruleilacunae]|nr:tetratricopeptide repeat protein [Puteibacter caeruleilacunae]